MERKTTSLHNPYGKKQWSCPLRCPWATEWAAHGNFAMQIRLPTTSIYGNSGQLSGQLSMTCFNISFVLLQWHLRCQSKFRLHLSPTLIHFNFFVTLNSIQNKLHKLTFWSSIQYFFIPASNIKTRLLVFRCGSALECDFLTIYFFPRCISHYCA